jgi:hypothetical protein
MQNTDTAVKISSFEFFFIFSV